MGEVIQFPKRHTEPLHNFPKNRREGNKRLKAYQKEFADSIAEVVINNLFNEIADFNILVRADGSHFKDNRFIHDALTSALYRYVGINHPLQKFVDENVPGDEEPDVVNDSN